MSKTMKWVLVAIAAALLITVVVLYFTVPTLNHYLTGGLIGALAGFIGGYVTGIKKPL